MIARAVRNEPNKSIFVFDVSREPFRRLQRFLAAHTRHTNFDVDERLRFIQGPAEVSLPEFLNLYRRRLEESDGNTGPARATTVGESAEGAASNQN
jgi:hypothetical protein